LFLLLISPLEVAVNYLIILPILAATYSFGFTGGLLSGTLGLSLNLLLLSLTGQLIWAPANLAMAQISGMVLGFGLGLTGSYLRRMEEEMKRRLIREEELNVALKEKEVLYRELNHRVKNNLNLIKSLIQLQIYRSTNGEFIAEADKLISRILSIALVHEQLYSGHLSRDLNLRDYLIKLTEQILASQSGHPVHLVSDNCDEDLNISMEKAVPVGLIVNEVVTNVLKYAFEETPILHPEMILELGRDGENLKIEISDNGRGFGSSGEGEGLGITLIKTLAGQLKGEYAYTLLPKGTRFTLSFPL